MSTRELLYLNCVSKDEKQWFWSYNFNALFERSLINEEIHMIIMGEKKEESDYSKVVNYQNKLILIPHSAENILIYDIDTGESRYIEIEMKKMMGEDIPVNKYLGYIIKDKWLFLTGGKTAHVLKFDMDEERVVGCIDLLANVSHKVSEMGYLREGIVWENKIVIPAWFDNIVFEVDIEELSVTMRRIEKNGCGFSTIHYEGDEIWLFPFEDEEIIIYNMKEKNSVLCNIAELMGGKCKGRMFLDIHRIGTTLWIIPRIGGTVLSYDLLSKKFSNINAINDYFVKHDLEMIGISSVSDGDRLFFLTEYCEGLFVFDTKTNVVKLVNNSIGELDLMKVLMRKERVLIEEENSLSVYLTLIKGI